ncbi:hypothetical protein L2E82_27440 [Cichorium intybus]|uniref:Uncharacterized protein n=1 Tax=Cichorium intybus TaxID=13427 RepID=A0ACB9CT11_CICIN|nr:hypothetical protein L2E82_27440 [Cichorium intybus]
MDLIHKFIYIISILLSVILFVFVLPPYLLFRILRFCFRSVFREKLAGKVVLITGASSGIGEHLAYEYAKHGANLALVARREELLTADCKRFVDETLKHFGKLDCLISNAGIAIIGFFEDQECITDHTSIMDINYWGSVNATHFALPHLRKSKGRIVVVGSCGGWFHTPSVSVYNASKAAQQSFFETLRIELASDIKITTVTLGTVNTPMAGDNFLIQLSGF